MIKLVIEQSQLEKVKAEICDKRCRFLYNANNVKAKSQKDLRLVADQLEKICAECPIGKLP